MAIDPRKFVEMMSDPKAAQEFFADSKVVELRETIAGRRKQQEERKAAPPKAKPKPKPPERIGPRLRQEVLDRYVGPAPRASGARCRSTRPIANSPSSHPSHPRRRRSKVANRASSPARYRPPVRWSTASRWRAPRRCRVGSLRSAPATSIRPVPRHHEKTSATRRSNNSAIGRSGSMRNPSRSEKAPWATEPDRV